MHKNKLYVVDISTNILRKYYLCGLFDKKMGTKTKGYLLGAVAAATYGMNPLFALPLYGNGMNPDSVLLFRYMFALPVIGVMLKMKGRSFSITRKELLMCIFLGLMMSLSSLMLFESYNHMDAGIASTLLFVYPIMVAIMMSTLYKERLTPVTILCIALALTGIWLLYKTGQGSTLSKTGTLMVMISALSYAVYIVGVNRPSLSETPTIKITFYVLLFGMLLFAGRLAWNRDITLPDAWYLWGNLLALGILPTAVSLLCTTSAIQYIGSTDTAILGALEPVTALLFGVTVFGERLSIRDMIGLVLIIVSVTLVIGGGKTLSSKLMRFRKLFPSLSGRRKQKL